MVSSSGSSQLQNSSSEWDLLAVMAQRRQRRMLSNRESARRSRVRKQKYLDDLAAQANNLRKENSYIITALNASNEHCVGLEAENSVLTIQMIELRNRLLSLNEILRFMNSGGPGGDGSDEGGVGFDVCNNDCFLWMLNSLPGNHFLAVSSYLLREPINNEG